LLSNISYPTLFCYIISVRTNVISLGLAAFLSYAAIVLAATFVLIYYFIPQYGQTHIMVYIGVCSLVGSLSVMSVKALGIALKLTFSGMNQLIYPQTWLFTIVVVACIVTQMNYLNKVIVIFIFDEIVQLCITSSIQYSLVVTFATCFLCFTWKWHLVIRMSMLLECSTWV